MMKDGISENAIAAYYRAIRAICNQAIKRDLMSQEWYPFKQFQIRTEATMDRSLSLEQLRKLYNVEPQNEQESWAKDLFFLSFALIGMNFTDMAYLTHENLVDGRVNYMRRKTGKPYSIKVHSFAQALMNRLILHNSTQFMLPILRETIPDRKQRSYIATRLKRCNQMLCDLARRCSIGRISTYYARYSWANLAKRYGASKDLIADSLGHSTTAVTDIYLYVSEQESIDDLNNLIIQNTLK
jgi:site-specific recombinase XerD